MILFAYIDRIPWWVALFFLTFNGVAQKTVFIAYPDIERDERLFAVNTGIQFSLDDCWWEAENAIQVKFYPAKEIHSVYIAMELEDNTPDLQFQVIDLRDSSLIMEKKWGRLPNKKKILTDDVVADSFLLIINSSASIRGRITHIFAQPSGGQRDDRYGLALPCHINANCPAASDWELQKKSVCRVVMAHEEGLAYCSGTLVNNTANDGTPYVLTAFHCAYFLEPIFDLWRFDFHFKTSDCISSMEAPSFLSFYGCDLIAGRLESDFLLLKMHEQPEAAHGLYFAGWNYSKDSIATAGVMLHHPRGDVMKFSQENDPLELIRTIINWGQGVITPPNHHIRAHWDLGTMEKGSSGAALFNMEKHIVGQLHGGSANCENLFRSNFGRLAMSWSEGLEPEHRLKDWLDPLGLDPGKWDGYSMEWQDTTTFTISWTVLTPDGKGIENLYREIDWPGHVEFIDMGNGLYLTRGWTKSDHFTWQHTRTDIAENGVDFLDLEILITHFNGSNPIEDPYVMLAADINQNGAIDAQDLRYFMPDRRTNQRSSALARWFFSPAVLTVKELTQDWEAGDVIGVKAGDLNFDRKL